MNTLIVKKAQNFAISAPGHYFGQYNNNIFVKSHRSNILLGANFKI